jgi:hypothetical protein
MNSAETSLFVQYFNEVATTLPSCSGYLPFTEENVCLLTYLCINFIT